MGALADRVAAALDRIRPAVELDGGELRLVRVDEAAGLVEVALAGACAGCSNQSTTTAIGVERALKQLAPGVLTVVTTTESSSYEHRNQR